MKKTGGIKSIPAHLLRSACDPNQLGFTTTSELEPLVGRFGQERALEALEFGIGIEQAGYNLCVIGPSGVGKRSLVREYLEQVVLNSPQPSDWCYVNNFADSRKPIALELPTGLGKELQQDMLNLVEQLRFSIPAIFESKEYRARIHQIDHEYEEREEQTIEALKEEAAKNEMGVSRTPNGFTVVAMRNGEVLSTQDLEQLHESEYRRREKDAAELRDKLTIILEGMGDWYKEKYKKEKAIENEFCTSIVRSSIKDLKNKYAECMKVIEYLSNVQKDIIDDPQDFLKREEGLKVDFGIAMIEKPSFKRYEVNVLVGANSSSGAPIVFENNPNYANLIGKMEHRSQFGTLFTDFTLLKPGSLHRANGGYLVLDILKLLMNPYAWESLKRVLLEKQISIESLGQIIGLSESTTLEPDPIPISVKVILLGDRYLYDLLGTFDSEFKKLFKVAVDFEDRIERSPDMSKKYSQLIAKLVRDENLAPFHCGAVARVIEHCVRLTENKERLSLHMQSLVEILNESDYWAGKGKNKVVQAEDVEQALESRVKRVERLRQRLYEEVETGSILIDVDGEAVGQINALSIIQLSDFTFGQPARITATTRVGDGKVIDIAREVKLGGPIHSKGVLILSGFLKGRYAKNRKLSLAASLVFEQTYAMVEGDSASVAELCALLSSLAHVPIKQALAVTGSVNQLGQVQAVGGVNEKIEGFFDICKSKGLTGNQGVLIPASNSKNLMLRQEVVDAVIDNKFHVYLINTVDEAISLLTGIKAGERDKDNAYPANTINHWCEAELQNYADILCREHKP